MVIKTASPGIIINEVDLTRGTSDAITTNVGCLCGPFQKGPVDELYKVDTQAELEKIFGVPTDENYEYWWTVSNFLEYGGVCYVVRVDDAAGDAQEVFGSDVFGVQTMRNASDILTNDGTGPYVKNDDDFFENTFGQGESDAHFIARNPGTWGNSLGVAVIDQGADYKMRLESDNIRPINRDLTPAEIATGPDILDDPDAPYPLIGFEFDNTLLGGTNVGRYYRAAYTGNIGVDLEDDDTIYPVFVKFYELDGSLDGIGYILPPVDNQPRSVIRLLLAAGNIQRGDTITHDDVVFSNAVTDVYESGYQLLYKLEGYPFTLTTEDPEDIRTDHRDDIYQNNLDLLAELNIKDPANPTNDPMIIDTIWEPKTYTKEEGSSFGWPNNPRPNMRMSPAVRYAGGPVALGETYIWNNTAELWINTYKVANGDVVTDGAHVYTIRAIADWYNTQVAFAGIRWHRFGQRPMTTLNAQRRNTFKDGINVIIYDAEGDITGSKGNVLESWFGLSKLRGALTPEGANNYYVDVINNDSFYLFANQPLEKIPSLLNGELTVGFSDTIIPPGDLMQSDKTVAYIAPGSRRLKGGVDRLTATLGEILNGYEKFDREEVFDLDYILQGPSRNNLDDATALANNLISIAETRMDCMVFISPPRNLVINVTDPWRVTDRLVEYSDGISSSSYAVIDSGYKQQYDRFRDRADMYVPLNGDIAGTVVYTAFRAEPWFSPAGFSRGQIRNVTKLPYNPTKRMRDDLYTNRINPVVTFKGEGTVLFGDKTALGYSSAFDRINVRRLFLVLEKEIAKISRNTLFEFNDEITRTLFKNNVNPFLRDVQSRRGMYDFLVVCDETNNTPEVIDRNEFIADLYIKPARSINFITLNFIATKTGVSFDESIALFRRNKT